LFSVFFVWVDFFSDGSFAHSVLRRLVRPARSLEPAGLLLGGGVTKGAAPPPPPPRSPRPCRRVKGIQAQLSPGRLADLNTALERHAGPSLAVCLRLFLRGQFLGYRLRNPLFRMSRRERFGLLEGRAAHFSTQELLASGSLRTLYFLRPLGQRPSYFLSVFF